MKYVSYWQKKRPVIVKQFFRLSAQLYVWEWSVGPLPCYGVVVVVVVVVDKSNMVMIKTWFMMLVWLMWHLYTLVKLWQ